MNDASDTKTNDQKCIKCYKLTEARRTTRNGEKRSSTGGFFLSLQDYIHMRMRMCLRRRSYSSLLLRRCAESCASSTVVSKISTVVRASAAVAIALCSCFCVACASSTVVRSLPSCRRSYSAITGFHTFLEINRCSSKWI